MTTERPAPSHCRRCGVSENATRTLRYPRSSIGALHDWSSDGPDIKEQELYFAAALAGDAAYLLRTNRDERLLDPSHAGSTDERHDLNQVLENIRGVEQIVIRELER